LRELAEFFSFVHYQKKLDQEDVDHSESHTTLHDDTRETANGDIGEW
jgi:hypothetical protein